MLPFSLDDLWSAGVSLFLQEDRLLELRFGAGAGLREATLIPHRLTGDEQLSQSYRYQLDCLSADASLDLKELIGLSAEIGLKLPDGGARVLTGLVTRAENTGSDGGFAVYRLVIEPALAILAHRRNSRVFQDKSVPDIVAAILDEHIAANPVVARSFDYQVNLAKSHPVRRYTLQYRESDLAFIERLLAEEGISYRYGHGPLAGVSRRLVHTAADDVPVHTLILFDANAALDDLQHGRVRFHRTDGVEEEDAIDQWATRQQVQPGRTILASYDYQPVATYVGEAAGRAPQGEDGETLHANLEDYDPQPAYYGGDTDDVARYATLRQQAHDLAGQLFIGQGTVRDLAPGSGFVLANHPVHDQDMPQDREFVVTGLSFEAENNLRTEAVAHVGTLLGISATDADRSRPPYRNSFQAVRRSVPIVPTYSRSRHQKPRAHGLTTATVVGPANEEIYTDEHGRIRIQFHWQRVKDHPEGGADFDDRSSTWVRVAMPSAGAGWGSQYIPRIGQEVVVDFIDGDIDRPLVTGVVYNGRQRPPAFSGTGSLPANKTLSGHQSKEYQGSRYNELLFDDTNGEIRTKLSSEHGKTQLNQGYLVHPRVDGKGEPRGEGFELRSDHAGALRAAKGLLITADARLGGQGNQLDRAELVGVLQVIESLHKQLAELANAHQADGTDTQQFSEILTHIQNWDKGSNTQDSKPDPLGGQPIIAASAAAGLAMCSQANIVVAAESHIDLASNQSVQISAGRNWLARAAESISLFAHQLHVKLVAGKGKVVIEAHADNIEATAAKEVIVTALERIVFRAPQIVCETSGAGMQIGNGAITTQCTGTHTQRAASHEINGPAGGSVGGSLPASSSGYDEKFKLQFPGGSPMANLPVVIKNGKGKTLWSGMTDAAGQVDVLKKDLPENIQIEFKKP